VIDIFSNLLLTISFEELKKRRISLEDLTGIDTSSGNGRRYFTLTKILKKI
jgi:hypothetical protein